MNHRKEIDAPYSPYGLAVKIREDEIEQWAALALLRSRWRRAVGTEGQRVQRPAGTTPVAGTFAPVDRALKTAVADALIAFEEAQNGPLQRRSLVLTEEPEAEAFVRENDLGFLLAVIFDQGVDYRMAWRAPLLLPQPLGHLLPERMVQEPMKVHEAIGLQPCLHRYVNKMPRWVVAAATRIVSDYGGEATTAEERRPYKAEVGGSEPPAPTRGRPGARRRLGPSSSPPAPTASWSGGPTDLGVWPR